MIGTQQSIQLLPFLEIPSWKLALDLLQLAPAMGVLANLWQDFEAEAKSLRTFDIPSALPLKKQADEIILLGHSAKRDANKEIEMREPRLFSPLVRAPHSAAE